VFVWISTFRKVHSQHCCNLQRLGQPISQPHVSTGECLHQCSFTFTHHIHFKSNTRFDFLSFQKNRAMKAALLVFTLVFSSCIVGINANSKIEPNRNKKRNDKLYIQPPKFAYIQLLNRNYENEVTLREQNKS